MTDVIKDLFAQLTGYDREATSSRREEMGKHIEESQIARQQALEAIEKVGLRRPGPLHQE